MGRRWIFRASAAFVTVLVGVLAATAGGAPFAAALIAMLAGVAAMALVWTASNGHRAPEPAIEPAGLPALPELAEVLRAIGEPLLIVRGRRVILANAAARAVLGEHIEGVDVRLAIRHPAAAERLADRAPGDATESVTRTELVGLGERERRWEMAATLLADGSRLVHLTDRSEAHASEQMRVDFVANASHELRTPLATLIGFSETLQDDAAASDAKTRSRFLKIMYDEARRMQRLIEDLISLSRIEAERFTLPRERIDLLPLVDEARAASEHLRAERGGGVIVDNRAGEAVVLGDRAQLLQLVTNLVVNALKYGRAGTDVRVRFDAAEADMLLMSVIDRGDGIAPEHLPRLTERFYRVDPSRSRAMGGTGLGLAIVKHIVGRHRGRLDIRSKLGEGTAVRVYLPRAQEALSSKSHANVTEVARDGPNGIANAN